jgi:ADP-heptose:LPS heptosyltransferase
MRHRRKCSEKILFGHRFFFGSVCLLTTSLLSAANPWKIAERFLLLRGCNFLGPRQPDMARDRPLPAFAATDAPRRIAVLRSLVLGDMLCAIPAMRALRLAFPHSEITLIGLPWAKQLVDRFPRYLDRFLEFPGFPTLPETPCDVARLPPFLLEAQRSRFDLVIQMHGSGEIMNPIALLLGGRRTAGFYRAGQHLPDPSRFFPYPEEEHEVRRNLRLIEQLGLPLAGEHLEFPIHDEDVADLKSLSESRGLRAGQYICLHPGARYPSRRWPVERYAALGDALSRRGLQMVITGAASESDLAAAVSSAMRKPHVNLAGRTSLGALAALLSGARLLVSNDTGVSHVAAALRVPSVVIVTGSDPTRWAPLDHVRHRIVRRHVACQPCVHVTCPIDHVCSLGIEPRQVEQAAIAMLDAFSFERDRQSATATNTSECTRSELRRTHRPTPSPLNCSPECAESLVGVPK